jgi:phosphodiesterase/alkaline phosphatase D-like protein
MRDISLANIRQSLNRRRSRFGVLFLVIIFLVSPFQSKLLYADSPVPDYLSGKPFKAISASPAVIANEESEDGPTLGHDAMTAVGATWDWDQTPLSESAKTEANEIASTLREDTGEQAVEDFTGTIRPAAPSSLQSGTAVAVTVSIINMSVQNESTWVVSYKINSGNLKMASFDLSLGLGAMMLAEADGAGNPFTLDLREAAIGFFGEELLAKKGTANYQRKLYNLTIEGLHYLPLSGKNDLTLKTLNAIDSASSGNYLTRALILNALSAIARHFSYGLNGNVPDFAVRERAHRAHANYFMHAALIETDNQVIVQAIFDFYKDPHFFSSSMTSMSGGWKVLVDGSVTLGYNLHIAGVLHSKRDNLPVGSAIRTYVINAWASVFTSRPNLVQTFKAAFPALQGPPWNEFDFDYFKSFALFAESSADVETVVEKLLPNPDQAWMFRTWRVLMVNGARNFSNKEFSNVRKWLSGYPSDMINRIGMISGNPTFVAGSGPDEGRGGYSVPLTTAGKQMLLLWGQPVYNGIPRSDDFRWIVDHELGHFFASQLTWGEKLLESKRWIRDTLFAMGTPEDRPTEGFKGCYDNEPTCTDPNLPYANSNAFENAAEFFASYMDDTAWFFDKWVDKAQAGRFIGLREYMSILEIFAQNSGGNQVPFYPPHLKGAGGGSPVYVSVTMDANKNIKQMRIPVLPNPPFNVPLEIQNKIFEFAYTSDSLQITTITIRNLTTGELVNIFSNPAVPQDTTPPVISLSAATNVTASSALIKFTMNEASYYQIEYSTSSNFAGSVKTAWSTALEANGSTPLVGLNENTTYYVRVLAKDALGNLGQSSTINFKTLPPQDTTAPVISLSAATNVTASSALIKFTMNESSYYQIEYSTSSNFAGSVKTAWSTTLMTSASRALNGLNANTRYYVRILAKDALGNLGQSSPINFTTLPPPDTTPPVITLGTATKVTASSASLSFTMNESSYYQIEYSTSSNFAGSVKTAWSTGLAASGSTPLVGLKENTTYYVRVLAKDGAGNLGQSSTINFKTLIPRDTTVPVITLSAATNVTASSALLRFTTNESATYQIEYSTSSNFAGSVKTGWSTVLATSGSKRLVGLKANTTYYVRVLAKDGAGNLGQSKTMILKTTR